MRKWIKLLVILLVCAGCSTVPEKADTSNKKEGQQETKQDGLMQLDMKTLKEKIDNKDTFIIMVSQSTCSYCNYTKRSVIPYIREHADLPFYELEVDMLGTKKSEIDQHFTELSSMIKEYEGGTPEFIYLQEGKVKQQNSGDLDEDGFLNFLVDCGLINEKKRETEIVETRMQKSSYLKEIDMIECARMLDAKETFYLYIAEEDRYNAMLSRTLASYAEEQKITVYVMNLYAMEEPKTEEAYEKLNKASEKVEKVFDTFQYTPSIFHVKEGTSISSLVDNVSDQELRDWFKK